jgi:TRAP-type C4-dicarboxylate transport system substrate-binding protein
MRKEFKNMVMRLMVVTLLCGLGIGISQTASAQAPAAPAGPAPSVVWRLDYYLPIQDSETIMLQQAADDILKFTTTAAKGGLKIEVYPANSLKLPGTQLSNLRDGLCEMITKEPDEEEAFTVTNASAIWPSKANQALAVDAMKALKARVYEKKWNSHYIASKMMTVQYNGIFTTNKKLNSPADLKGLKIRAGSNDQKLGFQKLGAAPAIMPSGEVYMALKTGVLDGAASGSRVLAIQKWGEVVKYAVETTLADSIAQDIAVNKKAWDAIPADWQHVVTAVFLGLEGRQRAMAVNPGMSEFYKKQCEAMGVQYNEWSAADKKAYDKTFGDLWLASLNEKMAKDATLKEAWGLVKKYTIVK